MSEYAVKTLPISGYTYEISSVISKEVVQTFKSDEKLKITTIKDEEKIIKEFLPEEENTRLFTVSEPKFETKLYRVKMADLEDFFRQNHIELDEKKEGKN